MMEINQDAFGEAVNGPETYKAIADYLMDQLEPILIGWTDGNGTHFDILFVYGAHFAGGFKQGGIRQHDLFVSIMRMGAFGFDTLGDSTVHAGYVEEKLGSRTSMGPSSEAVAELINGVRDALKARRS